MSSEKARRSLRSVVATQVVRAILHCTKRLASVLISAVVIAVVFLVARPLSGISSGAPLLFAAVAFVAGIGATYFTMTFLGRPTIPGSEGGRAR
jgi:hypothetical protein